MLRASIVILVKNRQRHLENVLCGIQRLSSPVEETIVIHMNEAARPAPKGFTGKFISRQLQNPDVVLPLAQARNLGAKLATGNVIIFLDVDCIPARSLVTDYLAALEQLPDAIAMGEV
ncbi:MAG: glycosyltransferase family A protein [Cyanobacteria bacterium J06626_18]